MNLNPVTVIDPHKSPHVTVHLTNETLKKDRNYVPSHWRKEADKTVTFPVIHNKEGARKHRKKKHAQRKRAQEKKKNKRNNRNDEDDDDDGSAGGGEASRTGS